MTFLKTITGSRTNANARNYALAAVAGGAALAAMALVARRQSTNAEINHPPIGKFIDVDGVKLHYIERGAGEPLVLIHGNVTQIQDFETSGLINTAARSFRVIVFDRPGFGYSSRPSSRIWTPSAQAQLLHKALVQLGIENAVVLGHSLGANVAVALALEFPAFVKRLVLVSGYYYPTDRFDAALQTILATPVIGDVLRHTIMPLMGRLQWPLLMKKLFGPALVSNSFSEAIREMALRPSQLGSAAADASLMIPNALSTQTRYGELEMPVSILVGKDDKLIDAHTQSMRLHKDIAGSEINVISGVGHMVHHEAGREVMEAIGKAA